MGLPGGTFNETYPKDVAIIRTNLQWALFGLLLIFLVILPFMVGTYVLGVIITFGISLIAVHGLNILTGYCGQISLGQAAFMAVGGYTSAVLTVEYGFPFLLSLVCAVLVSAMIGLLIGLPALRVKGFYLALVTLAAQFIITYLIKFFANITGGVDGMSVPSAIIGGLSFKDPVNYYFLTMVLAVIMTIGAKNLVRTRTGRAFIAIRDNDIAAETMGVNLFGYKLLAFLICSAYAGVAGSLLVHFTRYISPAHFSLMDSVWYLGMMIIGGTGSVLGAVLGTAFLVLVTEIGESLSPIITEVLPGGGTSFFGTIPLFVKGLAIFLFLIYEPRGLAHRWELFKSFYRLWPFRY